MKREELVRYDGEWYDANIVDCLLDEKDAEIAELKAENLNLKAKNIELQSFYNLHGNVDNYIDKLKAENESLKAKLESVQASAYADSVDASMRERRLRRALWLARANSAEGQFLYWCARFGVESGFTKTDIRGYSVNTKRRIRTIGEWIEGWKNVKSKCRAKAEEYK